MERDSEKLRAAFRALKATGWWARQRQEDGWKAVPEDIMRRAGKVVFWHAHEDAAFDDSGFLRRPLHLHHFDRDATELGETLVTHGLIVKIEGARVVVLPVRVR